jgi:hypothetical protein
MVQQAFAQVHKQSNVQKSTANGILQRNSRSAILQRHTNDSFLGGFGPSALTAKTMQSGQKPNPTGMPDRLKAGIEALSGLDVSNVRVHYNSLKPAQLQALAYTQGMDIYVRPGQERHLGHEAWHVVQQAKGRVKPIKQMNNNMNINDDADMEKEADIMGSRASQSANNFLEPFGHPKLQDGIKGMKLSHASSSRSLEVAQIAAFDSQIVQLNAKDALFGGVSGAAVGAGIGALLGSIAPGIGTGLAAGVGAAIVGIVGGIAGAIKGAQARTESALVRAANTKDVMPNWSCHNTVHNWLIKAGYANKNKFPARDPLYYQNAFYVGAKTPVRVNNSFTDTSGKIIVMYDVATNHLMHSMVSLGNGSWIGHNNLGTFGDAAPFTGTIDVAALELDWWQGAGNVLYKQKNNFGARDNEKLKIFWMSPSDIGAEFREE